MRNPNWAITFGDYELIVDRRTLTFRLTETKTGIVWADGVSLGWLDLRQRDTGEVTRHPFGAMQALSVSEKAGPQGKRILFGLDCAGIPVDVYLICAMREIQIQVEANRDSRSHQIVGFGLVPGLCAIPADGASYLVLPHGEGAILLAKDVPAEPYKLSIWDAKNGVNMPFGGGVRNAPRSPQAGVTVPPPAGAEGASPSTSALVLLTDSAYGLFHLKRHENVITLDPEYERDPERRRLDLRIVLHPNGDYIQVAQTYREKLINDGNHLTLRKKMRERPFLATSDLQTPSEEIFWQPCEVLSLPGVPSEESRWDVMDRELNALSICSRAHAFLLGTGGNDWANVGLDAVSFDDLAPLSGAVSVPLYDVVYRDCVIRPGNADTVHGFLDCLSRLHPALPIGSGKDPSLASPLSQGERLLQELYRLTFSAFLTVHCFLTTDFLVQEAVYSDKTRIVINQSETDTYETDEFTLPPLGFYARHRQLEAHDALRIGDITFPTRAWRIRRSRDGKPLEKSVSIEETEFPLPIS